ncbi:MAG: glutamate 5-kinase [Actinomycetota bacterium]|nr:glutamate 5-kinase [Actinomycetota bacterium]
MARSGLGPGDRLVVKVGTTSLLGPSGEPDVARMKTLCEGIAEVRAAGIDVVLVSSGAIAAGMSPLGLTDRPVDVPSLQALAAVGQGRLQASYSSLLSGLGLVAAQLLLTRYDFMHRSQYLNARNTLDRLLSLGSVPVVNENDTVAVDEISFGDNDRLAALVANLARARMLVLLTDAQGLHRADPRRSPGAPLIDEVERITPEIEQAAGGRGSTLATGGMSSKVAAAWVATFSGVSVVVAEASSPSVLARAAAGEPVGTYFHPRLRSASARRLWIAFAQPPRGTVVVDTGAREAVVERGRSLLPAGVLDLHGRFGPGDTVDVIEAGKDPSRPFARGLVRYGADDLAAARGRSTAGLAQSEVIHRDQLVILETAEVDRSK